MQSFELRYQIIRSLTFQWNSSSRFRRKHDLVLCVRHIHSQYFLIFLISSNFSRKRTSWDFFLQNGFKHFLICYFCESTGLSQYFIPKRLQKNRSGDAEESIRRCRIVDQEMPNEWGKLLTKFILLIYNIYLRSILPQITLVVMTVCSST